MQLFTCSMIILLSSFGFADDKSATGNGNTAAQTTAAAQVVAQTADDAKNISPVTAAAVDGVTKAMSVPSTVSAKSDITSDTDKATKVNLDAVSKQITAINTDLVGILPASKQGLTLVQNSVNDYFGTKKKSCASTAETANFLCSEGSSPGAKAVKILMDVGAPVLGAISSAQKACSTTAKITAFASSALTVAKGVCIAAKTTCDFSCSTATAQLATIESQIQSFISYFDYDVTSTMTQLGCPESLANVAICKQLAEIKISVPPKATAMASAIKPEDVASNSGTSTNLAAKCSGYTKDIALMGVNLVSLLAAKKGADTCSDSLKSSTAAGTTALQYCETPANTNTQYCICLKDNTKVGCPGYVATVTTTTTGTTAENGVDVKSTGTGNQFASGATAVKPTSALGSVDGLGTTAATTAAQQAAATTATNAGLTAAGSGAVSGSSASGAPTADLGASAKDAKAGSDKKWSFGSFSGAGGGGYGGSDSSANAGSTNKLGQKDMDALKRQIASEQLRAEVSEASGKSNWEKVRERYLMNSGSLLNGK